MTDVVALRSRRRRDTIYTTNPDLYDCGATAEYTNLGTVFTAYAQPLPDLDPVFQLASRSRGQHLYTDSVEERNALVSSGQWRPEGIAFYSVSFPNAAGL